MGSGTGCAVAQHPLRLLEGWDKEVYLAQASGCAPSCANCCRFARSVDIGLAVHHVPGSDRVVPSGAVPRRKSPPVVGMEEECQEERKRSESPARRPVVKWLGLTSLHVLVFYAIRYILLRVAGAMSSWECPNRS